LKRSFWEVDYFAPGNRGSGVPSGKHMNGFVLNRKHLGLKGNPLFGLVLPFVNIVLFKSSNIFTFS
jgi:hypothetical protein